MLVIKEKADENKSSNEDDVEKKPTSPKETRETRKKKERNKKCLNESSIKIGLREGKKKRLRKKNKRAENYKEFSLSLSLKSHKNIIVNIFKIYSLYITLY